MLHQTNHTPESITQEAPARIDWVAPFSFSRHGDSFGISRNWSMAPFIVEVPKIIVGVPGAGPSWWIERAIEQKFARQSSRELETGEKIDLRSIRIVTSLYSIELTEPFSSDFIRVARRYGLEHCSDGTFERTAEVITPPGEELSASYRESLRGPLAIPEIPIPDRCDPRIYKPDIGTHMGTSGTREQWAELMEWEGRSDADCILRYLSAYNAFIREPTGERLMEAAFNPRTGTGPYFLCMTYIAGVFSMPGSGEVEPNSPQKKIYDLLSLMHTAFMTSFSREAIGQSVFTLAPCDKRLCDGLAHIFASTHRSGEE